MVCRVHRSLVHENVSIRFDGCYSFSDHQTTTTTTITTTTTKINDADSCVITPSPKALHFYGSVSLERGFSLQLTAERVENLSFGQFCSWSIHSHWNNSKNESNPNNQKQKEEDEKEKLWDMSGAAIIANTVTSSTTAYPVLTTNLTLSSGLVPGTFTVQLTCFQKYTASFVVEVKEPTVIGIDFTSHQACAAVLSGSEKKMGACKSLSKIEVPFPLLFDHVRNSSVMFYLPHLLGPLPHPSSMTSYQKESSSNPTSFRTGLCHRTPQQIPEEPRQEEEDELDWCFYVAQQGKNEVSLSLSEVYAAVLYSLKLQMESETRQPIGKCVLVLPSSMGQVHRHVLGKAARLVKFSGLQFINPITALINIAQPLLLTHDKTTNNVATAGKNRWENHMVIGWSSNIVEATLFQMDHFRKTVILQQVPGYPNQNQNENKNQHENKNQANDHQNIFGFFQHNHGFADINVHRLLILRNPIYDNAWHTALIEYVDSHHISLPEVELMEPSYLAKAAISSYDSTEHFLSGIRQGKVHQIHQTLTVYEELSGMPCQFPNGTFTCEVRSILTTNHTHCGDLCIEKPSLSTPLQGYARKKTQECGKTIAVKTADATGMQIIIAKEDPFPLSKEMIFKTITSNQTVAEILIYEDLVILFRFNLQLPSKPAGDATITIRYNMDESGILSVAAISEIQTITQVLSCSKCF